MSPPHHLPDESVSDSTQPDGDPWAAFGYIAAGVLVYGAIGWGLSAWLHASYWIPIGILVGAGFGMFMVFARYRVRPSDTAIIDRTPATSNAENAVKSTAPIDDDAARNTRPASDDRGETA